MAKLPFIASAILFITPFLSNEPGLGAADIDGSRLYSQLCLSCHGKSGSADGRAARFLFPPPRNLRNGRFRIVSSLNRVASSADIRRVLMEGMPGTAMQSWKELGDAKINALVAHVEQLRRDGARERIEASLREEGDAVLDHQNEIDAYIRRFTEAAEHLQYSPLSSRSDSVVAEGKLIYLRLQCHSCHGIDGEGSRGMDLVDSAGRPTWATDLRRGQFHGGHNETAVARRIVLGMPGSAMPSSSMLPPEQLGSLVAYVLSLGESPRDKLTNHQRRERAIGRVGSSTRDKSP